MLTKHIPVDTNDKELFRHRWRTLQKLLHAGAPEMLIRLQRQMVADCVPQRKRWRYLSPRAYWTTVAVGTAVGWMLIMLLRGG